MRQKAGTLWLRRLGGGGFAIACAVETGLPLSLPRQQFVAELAKQRYTVLA
jgi:hypothetical protein